MLNNLEGPAWGEGQDSVNVFSLEDLTMKVSVSPATETQNVALL